MRKIDEVIQNVRTRIIEQIEDHGHGVDDAINMVLGEAIGISNTEIAQMLAEPNDRGEREGDREFTAEHLGVNDEAFDFDGYVSAFFYHVLYYHCADIIDSYEEDSAE